MDLSNVEFIKSALIKRELETSPWQAIQDLAKRHLESFYSTLSLEQLEPFFHELHIDIQLDMKNTICELSESVLVNANFTETINYATKCLESEYSKIDYEDLLVLHRLFINEEGSQKGHIPNLDLVERL
ncbi:MAG: hypothetical protein CME71_04340 [Halobacteriovorax sp.]|nr:hypothetical protein [Halobacteriovorax sp.]